jgi:hypothetical protein
LHPDPIPNADDLTRADFLKRNPPAHLKNKVLYKCRCGNKLELHIQAEAVTCVKCGYRMRPL